MGILFAKGVTSLLTTANNSEKFNTVRNLNDSLSGYMTLLIRLEILLSFETNLFVLRYLVLFKDPYLITNLVRVRG